jgi:diguanylate cyclase (GGDEF)-like protein
MGSVLLEATRSTDIVGRYGGDEFIIALPQTSIEDTELLGKRIAEGLRRNTIVNPNGSFQLRTSIGSSMLNAPRANAEEVPIPVLNAYFREAGQALIKLADDSLYQAKRNGGNQFHQGALLDWSSISVGATATENQDA